MSSRISLRYPIYRLREEGAIVHLVGKEKDKKYIGKYGVPAVSDYDFSEVRAEEYDAILVPGGWAPDKLRRYEEVLEYLRIMDRARNQLAKFVMRVVVLIIADIFKR